MCKCDDGTAATGAACTEHDASICASCDAGFTITCDKTACKNIGLTFLREEESTEFPVEAFCIEANAFKCDDGTAASDAPPSLGWPSPRGSGGGSTGSKSDNLDLKSGTLDLSDLFGDSKSQSTFGEWASSSDKQECRSVCRSECRAVSAGSY